MRVFNRSQNYGKTPTIPTIDYWDLVSQNGYKNKMAKRFRFCFESAPILIV